MFPMDPELGHDAVQHAISEIAAGRPVIVFDDEDRENEGDLIVAAELATPEVVTFLVRHTGGLLCVGMDGDRLDALQLPQMVPQDANRDANGTAFTVSVDAASGISTGISAADRSHTVRLLANPASTPSDLVRPGHVFPLRAAQGGVLRRTGHTEAASDLARLAGLAPAGLLSEIVTADGSMARRPQLQEFASEHGLAIISISDLVRFRLARDRVVHRVALSRLPSAQGSFEVAIYESLLDSEQHLALIKGDPRTADSTLVRVHSECLTGDVLGSLRCDCGEQLRQAIAQINAEGSGVIVYLRGHEGRGIGLAHKIQAYALQDDGLDTVEANLSLGLPIDSRHYGIGAQILADIGITRMRLMTNNPQKYTGLADFGLDITERVPIDVEPNLENVRYLRTKKARLGHLLAPERVTPDRVRPRR